MCHTGDWRDKVWRRVKSGMEQVGCQLEETMYHSMRRSYVGGGRAEDLGGWDCLSDS